MPWLLILVAGLLEVVWAVALKESAAFTRLWPSVIMLVGLIASMILLALGMRDLPVGTAYAVWTGIGAVGAAVAGILRFGESADPARLMCIALIVLGIVGLKFASPT